MSDPARPDLPGPVGVAVPAAGAGRRMGGQRKPWLELAGEPLLLHALRPFLEHPRVTAVRVALGADDAADPPEWLTDLDPRIDVVPGGATRALSVREAVRALPEDVTCVMVHDAARALVTSDMIDRCEAALGAAAGGVLGGAVGDGAVADGAVAGWPAVDTLKEVDAEGVVVATPDRSRFWHAQTPQAFHAPAFREALEHLEEMADIASLTDDASLAEAVGLRVVMVKGGAWNLKVTRPEDLAVAELLLGRMG